MPPARSPDSSTVSIANSTSVELSTQPIASSGNVKPNVQPSLRHPPPPPPPPSPPLKYNIPFTTIIEHDHRHLSHLAARATTPTLPLSTRLNHFTDLLWRLIRHDISEELVMRPAFAHHLGTYGAEVAAEDRRDHATLKGELVGLYRRAVEGQGLGEGRLVDEITRLGREMGKHMREESGVVLPRFKGVVDRSTSLELGERYARTLALTMEVVMSEVDGRGGTSCSRDVLCYAGVGMDEFRRVLRELEGRAEMGVDGGYLERKVEEEMEVIGLRLGKGTRVGGDIDRKGRNDIDAKTVRGKL